MIEFVIALGAGFLLDWIFGDPRALPHPVVYIGKLIAFLEKKIRACVTCDGKLGEDNELYPFLLCPMNHIGNHSCIVCRIRNSELRRCRSNLHESVNHSYMINTRPKKVKRHL